MYVSLRVTHSLITTDNIDAAIAAIVLQHSNACTQYQTSDDIFASVAQDLGPGQWNAVPLCP